MVRRSASDGLGLDGAASGLVKLRGREDLGVVATGMLNLGLGWECCGVLNLEVEGLGLDEAEGGVLNLKGCEGLELG